MTAVCPGPVRTEFFDIAQTTGEIPLYKKLVMADRERLWQKQYGTVCRERGFRVWDMDEGILGSCESLSSQPDPGYYGKDRVCTGKGTLVKCRN